MSQYVVSVLDEVQDVMDWWVGPIGFILPSKDQYVEHALLAGFTAGAEYVIRQAAITAEFSKMAEHRIAAVYRANPGKVYPKAALRRMAGRQVAKGSAARGFMLTMGALPTPLSLLFWTLTIAYSLPPSGRAPVYGRANVHYDEHTMM